ncbi:MAG TPA: acetylxylan esterase [Spirochaetota bacterium]|nr:acetylxylan esterase [Spirochaetota bacterium]HPC42920.1 acetylxylan esterase [Spirochaetota bacterium]HPL18348.1 acetylxylan esterase [Spirochaetota bacterium]HQF10020.1 acetylxylan esterase [Spirochaetota bacterium]HQH98616.1 acetylxylan esterase [Spirochaetota bacterium]
MPLSNFDKYFLNLPPQDKKNDFDQFWEKAIADIKKIPLETELVKNGRRTTHRFASYDVSYKGFTKTTVTGELLIPRGTPKPKVIMYVHDYNSEVQFSQQTLDDSASYFFINLRGHTEIVKPADTEEEPASPGFMVENILDRDTYYVKAVYLDLYRSIDMLRLIPDINCSAIGIIGKGFGAAAAVFTTAFSDRVAALVMETPAFCHLSLSQNISESDASNEINEFVSTVKAKKKQIKDNLTYFDALNFADRITCPVLATVGFKDTISPPECVFSLFNHIRSEKVIEVYPEEGNAAGGAAQFKKSIQWLVKQINQ